MRKIDLEHLFNYHRPTPDKIPTYNDLREAAKAFAKEILRLTPRGEDQDAAIRKVREAVMTANAAVALDGRILELETFWIYNQGIQAAMPVVGTHNEHLASALNRVTHHDCVECLTPYAVIEGEALRCPKCGHLDEPKVEQEKAEARADAPTKATLPPIKSGAERALEPSEAPAAHPEDLARSQDGLTFLAKKLDGLPEEVRARHDRALYALRKAWTCYPSMRLGQLILNVMDSNPALHHRDLFGVGDDLLTSTMHGMVNTSLRAAMLKRPSPQTEARAQELLRELDDTLGAMHKALDADEAAASGVSADEINARVDGLMDAAMSGALELEHTPTDPLDPLQRLFALFDLVLEELNGEGLGADPSLEEVVDRVFGKLPGAPSGLALVIHPRGAAFDPACHTITPEHIRLATARQKLEAIFLVLYNWGRRAEASGGFGDFTLEEGHPDRAPNVEEMDAWIPKGYVEALLTTLGDALGLVGVHAPRRGRLLELIRSLRAQREIKDLMHKALAELATVLGLDSPTGLPLNVYDPDELKKIVDAVRGLRK